MGTILLALRIFDAVQDPFIGYLCGRYAKARTAITLSSLIAMAGAFVMLYNPPQDYVALWFAVSVAIATLAFSVLAISMNAAGSLWSRDTQEKTAITSVREAYGIGGLFLATIFPVILASLVSGDKVYSLYGLLTAGIIAVCGCVYLFWLRKAHLPQVTVKKFTWVLPCGKIARFYLVYAFSILASSLPTVLVLFFIRDRLDAEGWTGLFLALYFAAGIGAMPVWKALATRIGKAKTWSAAMVFAILVFGWAFFLGEGDLIAYALICVLSGAALGAELSIPPSLLSDLIDEEAAQANTATFFSYAAFLSKAMLAIATAGGFFLLDTAAFVPASENSENALFMLSFVYAGLPLLIKAGAVWFLYQNFIKERLYYAH
jgi:Na+/melibiose symporter-like transporter